jgi:hypothetical protein
MDRRPTAAHRQFWLTLLALVFAPIILLSAPVRAQDGPQGIGFAQAEEGTWICRAGDPVTALNCARDLCRAGAGGQDCYRTAWCFPSGWSGVLTVWLSDFHANRPICGASTLPALLDVMLALCNEAEGATACDVGMVFDPVGTEIDVAQHWVPARSPCNADRAAFAVQQPITDELAERARLAAGAETVRVVRPGQPITMDLRMDRLNINLDGAGAVTQVRCG